MNSHFPTSLSDLTPQFLPHPPVEPKTKLPYEYKAGDDGKHFQLCTQLDTTKDKRCSTDTETIKSPDFPNRGSGF